MAKNLENSQKSRISLEKKIIIKILEKTRKISNKTLKKVPGKAGKSRKKSEEHKILEKSRTSWKKSDILEYFQKTLKILKKVEKGEIPNKFENTQKSNEKVEKSRKWQKAGKK